GPVAEIDAAPPRAHDSASAPADEGSAAADDAAPDESAPTAEDAAAAGDDGASVEGPSSAPKPSALCGMAAMPAPDGYQNLTVTGKARKFIIRVPKSYDGKHAFPVIFAFHGRGSDATSFDTKFGFRAAAGDTNILVMAEAYGP